MPTQDLFQEAVREGTFCREKIFKYSKKTDTNLKKTSQFCWLWPYQGLILSQNNKTFTEIADSSKKMTHGGAD